MDPNSIGAQRVRLGFNPSTDSVVDVIKSTTAPVVDVIKSMTADLIDLCETLKAKDARLASLAQTAYEEACMWAVKAETTPAAEPEALGVGISDNVEAK